MTDILTTLQGIDSSIELARRLKRIIEEKGPCDAEWLASASEEDILHVVDDGNLNLCMDYIMRHRDLLEALWELEDKGKSE